MPIIKEVIPLIGLVGSAVTCGTIFATKKLYEVHPFDPNRSVPSKVSD